MTEEAVSRAHAATATHGDSSDDESSTPNLSRASRQRTLRRRSSLSSERWVPYKQTNGVAVYYLDETTSSSHGLGGEYMVGGI